ncbi:helix-turn-helix domain-containing protein [Streptomyces sp. NBC_01257]|uniref:helix-turn-helix domain-containing protein n=1 Tax=Streptomyces sp. NBC_01257 TaxID=2903799 RepID=UPI002DD7C2FA|nr:helix-turn-helix domain-containing protein [Streptomyces sp. NBC_01257]WRZ69952.1 helix-turn-helix domain-containing protein [Streptomyces sp. NBC_01257]
MNTLAPEVTPEAADVDPAPLLLTVEEAARRLRIGRTLCYSLIRSGDLESVTIGSLRRVPPEAIPAFVARLRKSNSAAA